MANSPQPQGNPQRNLFKAGIGRFILVFTLPLFLLWSVTFWPPGWAVRRSQRAALAERVRLAGGWDAVRRGCMALAEQHTNYFYYCCGDRDTNLPPAIVAMKPVSVAYDPNYGRVHMSISERYSTNGRSWPYFDLEVVTKKTDDYTPGGGEECGKIKTIAQQVADGIYEIFGVED
jgi:hypothetical protein